MQVEIVYHDSLNPKNKTKNKSRSLLVISYLNLPKALNVILHNIQMFKYIILKKKKGCSYLNLIHTLSSDYEWLLLLVW